MWCDSLCSRFITMCGSLLNKIGVNKHISSLISHKFVCGGTNLNFNIKSTNEIHTKTHNIKSFIMQLTLDEERE